MLHLQQLVSPTAPYECTFGAETTVDFSIGVDYAAARIPVRASRAFRFNDNLKLGAEPVVADLESALKRGLRVIHASSAASLVQFIQQGGITAVLRVLFPANARIRAEAARFTRMDVARVVNSTYGAVDNIVILMMCQILRNFGMYTDTDDVVEFSNPPQKYDAVTRAHIEDALYTSQLRVALQRLLENTKGIVPKEGDLYISVYEPQIAVATAAFVSDVVLAQRTAAAFDDVLRAVRYYVLNARDAYAEEYREFVTSAAVASLADIIDIVDMATSAPMAHGAFVLDRFLLQQYAPQIASVLMSNEMFSTVTLNEWLSAFSLRVDHVQAKLNIRMDQASKVSPFSLMQDSIFTSYERVLPRAMEERFMQNTGLDGAAIKGMIEMLNEIYDTQSDIAATWVREVSNAEYNHIGFIENRAYLSDLNLQRVAHYHAVSAGVCFIEWEGFATDSTLSYVYAVNTPQYVPALRTQLMNLGGYHKSPLVSLFLRSPVIATEARTAYFAPRVFDPKDYLDDLLANTPQSGNLTRFNAPSYIKETVNGITVQAELLPSQSIASGLALAIPRVREHYDVCRTLVDVLEAATSSVRIQSNNSALDQMQLDNYYSVLGKVVGEYVSKDSYVRDRLRQMIAQYAGNVGYNSAARETTYRDAIVVAQLSARILSRLIGWFAGANERRRFLAVIRSLLSNNMFSRGYVMAVKPLVQR